MNPVSRILLGLVSGVVLSVLLLEGLLWLLPTFNGIFAADPDPSWPVEHLLPTERYTYSTSWNFRNVRHGAINDMGYVAPFEYRTNHAFAAVLGDSYAQALMIRYDDSVAGQLASLSSSDPSQVLNFGYSGNALPDYLGLGPLVRERFHPDWVVVFIGDGDFVEGFETAAGHFRWNDDDPGSVELVPDQTERSALIKIMRHDALLRYLRSNLRFTVRGMFHSEPAAATDSPKQSCADVLEARDRERITRYVEELPGAFGVPAGKVIFLRDSEALRKGLYGTDSSGRNDCSQSRDSQALELLVAEAQRAGMNVVDSLPLFRSHYATTGERVDSSPTDWHWNETGHKIAAAAIHKLMVSR